MGTQVSALDLSEYKTIEAMAGRIMPTTDEPGAIEAGAANYIQQALADIYSRHLPTYKKAISEFNRCCSDRLGQAFAHLDADQQDQMLRELESGRLKEVSGGDSFFELVRTHVMEGFFCEPHYGGNRNMVGWKLVGFPGQQYGYADPFINRTIDMPPVEDARGAK